MEEGASPTPATSDPSVGAGAHCHYRSVVVSLPVGNLRLHGRYRIWIHRSRVLLPQLFLHRLNAACIWSDCISGVIVTAAIILSFLSLMTFADFLADQLLRCGEV